MPPTPDVQEEQTIGTPEAPRRDAILRALDRVVNDGIVLLTPDGRTVEYVNESACRLLSSSPEPSEVLAALHPVMGEAQSGRLTRIESGEAGPHRSLLVEVSPLEEEDCRGILVILKDARAMDVLEEDIFLANRMRGVSETVLALAHDLKAPINAVTLNLDVLRESLAGAARGRRTTAERLEVVDAIRDELVRLQRSLQAVLVQTAPAKSALRTFDLRRLLREVARTVRPLAEGCQVRIHLDPGDEPAPVRGHRDRLGQALRSVLVNAIEASPRLAEVRVEVRRRRKEAILAVRDEGSGFPSLDAERLCRLHYTTKSDGSGIGLFVTRAAVVAHGGTMRFLNRQEGGAAVEIRLPIHLPRRRA
ncbi:MAG TPA: PAS domain-containing sensor histidine kinase [bacterium]|nr:PAS domain-containing sensor histidine kinase [bacterium]